MTDASLKELRLRWQLGEETFARKVLDVLSGVIGPTRKTGGVAGEAAKMEAVLVSRDLFMSDPYGLECREGTAIHIATR